ncbi:MAG: bifunctional oligoribonuclease/PAP phosphatase NrnA [Coprobacillus sp.]|nr:bifunctional oligoribonuclease/PAP phosphatase NrnA [Coprobacillus sp.]
MFEQVLSSILSADSIAIFTHRNPDGDSYASIKAMKELIETNYPAKKVYLCSSGVSYLECLFGPCDKVSDDEISKSLALFLDCRETGRIEDQRYKLAPKRANIDHHPSDEEFIGPSVNDINACSTCELIYDFARESGLVINERCANMLYLGITTDTNRCNYASDFERLFNCLSDLVRLGADPDSIYRVLNVRSIDDISIREYIYSHYNTSKNGVIYIAIDNKTIHELGYTTNGIAGYINTIGNLIEYPIWIFFLENDDGSMRCEFRSREIPVHPYAITLGGGGHMLASGATLKKFDYNKINEIVQSYDSEILKFKE